jgi:hypothetical protein
VTVKAVDVYWYADGAVIASEVVERHQRVMRMGASVGANCAQPNVDIPVLCRTATCQQSQQRGQSSNVHSFHESSHGLWPLSVEAGGLHNRVAGSRQWLAVRQLPRFHDLLGNARVVGSFLNRLLGLIRVGRSAGVNGLAGYVAIIPAIAPGGETKAYQ